MNIMRSDLEMFAARTVELAMALEAEFGIDEPGSKPGLDTFRDLVIHRARRRAA